MKQHAAITAVLAVPSMVLCAACGPGSRGDGFSLADSAGVAIATNRVPLDDTPSWRLEEPALLVIGATGNDPAYQFAQALGGARLADGRIAILEAGDQAVRYYGPDGAHLYTSGGKGDGPGEFQLAARILRLGADTLMVWDNHLRRATVLDPQGRVTRTTQLQSGNYQFLVTTTANGGFLAGNEFFTVPRHGFKPWEIKLVRHSPDGAAVTTVASYFSAPLGRIGGAELVGRAMFAALTILIGRPGGYFVGTGKASVVTAHDEYGAVQRIIRWAEPDRTITTEDVERYSQSELAKASPDRRQQVERMLALQPVSDQFPAFHLIMADRTGALRVQEFQRPTAPGPPPWLAFALDGRLIGRLTVPRGFRILEWGDDYMLGAQADADGVELIVLHRLLRER